MYWICLFLPFFSLLGAADKAAQNQLAFFHEEKNQLIVNNRILARVNNKTISVLDVMKKMDVFLARNYPQYANSAAARFQFFSTNWKDTLNQIINNELMMADAEKLDLKLNDADVREKLHERFGPNVMQTLDKLHLTFDEAWQMLYTELASQRILWYRVNSKAFQKIGPQDIKEAFKKFCQENPPKETWVYQVISIRSKDEQLASKTAEKIAQNLSIEKGDNDALMQKVKDQKNSEPDSEVAVSVSQEYKVENKDLSESLKQILFSLSPGGYSKPVLQVSKTEKITIHRIYFLKDHTKQNPPVFEEMSDKLYDTLIQEEVNRGVSQYFVKLREKMGLDDRNILENIPENFQPFSYR
ncbi:MAG: hypothetical protein L0207_01570 [Chlamydiae bacterium]|nr:hypothetical protein [Chlamydiota bacterium]